MEMIVIPRLSHNNNGVRKAKKKRAQTVNPSGAEQKKKKKPGGGVGSVSAHSNFHRSNTYTAVVYHIRVYKYNNASDGPKAIVSRASSPPPRQQHLDSIITYVFFFILSSLSPPPSIYMLMGEPRGCRGVKKPRVRHMSILSLLRDFVMWTPFGLLGNKKKKYVSRPLHTQSLFTRERLTSFFVVLFPF